MSRLRTIPDADIFVAVRALLATGGEKAVAFSSVARATGLAAPTLVQRYGSRDGMLRAALSAGWDDLDNATAKAEGDAPLTTKGAVAFLRALGAEDGKPADIALRAAEFRDPVLRARAAEWRCRIETALAVRLGGGAKGREAAGIIFAVWQGKQLWQATGARTFRLKDAVKRLG